MSDEEQLVTIISEDGVEVPCKKEAALLAGVIKNMIEEDDENEDNEELKLLKVSGETLRKVVELLEHYVDEPMEILTETPLQMTKLEECVGPEWYVKFADIDREEMFGLVKAANYMDVPPLLDLMCLAITMSIIDKSPEEIRGIFSTVNPSLAAPPQAA